jgi:hypothetical protein
MEVGAAMQAVSHVRSHRWPWVRAADAGAIGAGGWSAGAMANFGCSAGRDVLAGSIFGF